MNLDPTDLAMAALALTSTAWGLIQTVRLRRSRSAALASLGQIDGALGDLVEQVATLSAQSMKLVEEKQNADRLASVHMSKNQEFQQQAQDAWTLFRESGLRASNAQALMLQEIDRLARQVNKYRQEKGDAPLQINPALADIHQDFKRDFLEKSTP